MDPHLAHCIGVKRWPGGVSVFQSHSQHEKAPKRAESEAFSKTLVQNIAINPKRSSHDAIFNCVTDNVFRYADDGGFMRSQAKWVVAFCKKTASAALPEAKTWGSLPVRVSILDPPLMWNGAHWIVLRRGGFAIVASNRHDKRGVQKLDWCSIRFLEINSGSH